MLMLMWMVTLVDKEHYDKLTHFLITGSERVYLLSS